jgi:hypothetical protein
MNHFKPVLSLFYSQICYGLPSAVSSSKNVLYGVPVTVAVFRFPLAVLYSKQKAIH